LATRLLQLPKLLIENIAMEIGFLLKHKPLHQHGDVGVCVNDAVASVNLNNDVGPLAGKVVFGKVEFCFHKFILTQG